MTQLFESTGITMTIPSGLAVTPNYPFIGTLDDNDALFVQAPAALDALTYTWEGSNDGGLNYVTLQDSTAVDLKVPAAGKGFVLNGLITALTHIRIKATGNAAADRSFRVTKSFRA